MTLDIGHVTFAFAYSFKLVQCLLYAGFCKCFYVQAKTQYSLKYFIDERTIIFFLLKMLLCIFIAATIKEISYFKAKTIYTEEEEKYFKTNMTKFTLFKSYFGQFLTR